MFSSCYISGAIAREPIIFRRLLPPGPPADVEEIVQTLGLHERPRTSARPRPYVVVNMISTLDGRATLGGRSGPISGEADRALFHGLRSLVDAVIVGAGTVRSERYGPLIPDPEQRRLRLQRGLSEQPLMCVVSGRLALAAELPLLADPQSRVAIVTSSSESLPEVAAQIDYVRAERDGRLDFAAALAELHERLRVRTLLCEGGPHLNGELFSADLVDEVFLCLAAKLVGEEPGEDRGALRILAGMHSKAPVELDLVSALEHRSYLFLRYRVPGGG